MLEFLARRMTSRSLVARLTAVLLIAVFGLPLSGGACCSRAAPLAVALGFDVERPDGDCCPGDAGSGEMDGAPCSCPFPCAPGCVGHLGRAFVQGSPIALAAPARSRAEPFRPTPARHSNPDPHDILHVPKPLRA